MLGITHFEFIVFIDACTKAILRSMSFISKYKYISALGKCWELSFILLRCKLLDSRKYDSTHWAGADHLSYFISRVCLLWCLAHKCFSSNKSIEELMVKVFTICNNNNCWILQSFTCCKHSCKTSHLKAFTCTLGMPHESTTAITIICTRS